MHARLARSRTWSALRIASVVSMVALAATPVGAQPAVAPNAASDVAPSSESRVGAGLFARTEYLSLPAAAFQRARIDMGLRFRPLDHLAIDVGIGLGGGRMRRPSGQDRLTEIGLMVDVAAYLNPRSLAQVYVVGGVGLGAAGSSEQVGSVDPDCPSDSLFFADLSIGLGLELVVSETVSLFAATRLVRRTSLGGELEFLSDSTNPPDAPVRSVLGAAAELRVVLNFGPAPDAPR